MPTVSATKILYTIQFTLYSHKIYQRRSKVKQEGITFTSHNNQILLLILKTVTHIMSDHDKHNWNKNLFLLRAYL